jgi:phosphohistidine phosphatase
MHVFLVRHGHSDPGNPDDLRPLSSRGRNEARTLAEALAGHPTPPELVVSSPLLRARETAEAIAEATSAELRVDERLAPGATLELLRQALEGIEATVAAVGHQPDCSEIAIALTGDDPGFPTGGFFEVELRPDEGSG